MPLRVVSVIMLRTGRPDLLNSVLNAAALPGAAGQTEEEAADQLWWLVQHVRLLQHQQRLHTWLQLCHRSEHVFSRCASNQEPALWHTRC